MKKHILRPQWISGLFAVVLAGTLLASWGFAQEAREPRERSMRAERMHTTKMRGDDDGPRHHRLGRPRHHRGPGEHLARMQAALDLTEEQAGHVRDLLLGAHKNAIIQRAELRVAELNLRDTMTRPDVDQKAVEQYVQQISEARQTLLRQHVDTMLQVHALLTPEQRVKARAFLLGSHKHPRPFLEEDGREERQ